MNEIKIYLKTSGRIAELYKDFDLYEGCYRNSQMSVYVPKSLLYENEGGTFANLVKTGAILTAPNGTKLTTKTYYLDYVKTETVVGIAYAVYTTITPKEFCVYAGTQTVVVNVESIDNTDKDNQKVISVTTTQTANLIVLESAYLGQDEPIEPTELDKIKATLTEIEGDITGLQSKVSDISDKVSTLSDVTTELMSDVDNLSIQVSDLSEDKLDKQSGATAYEEAYVKDTDGSQKMERVTISNIAHTIVKRDANGNFSVGKGSRNYPSQVANMGNISDVEEEVSKKYDKTGGTIDGNVTVTGDLTVQGTTITENAETLDVKANVITTNSEGVPLINLSGLGIRTDATNVYGIMYDPQSDSVKLGLGSLDEDNNFTFNQGEGLPIAVRDDSTVFTDKHVIVWDAAGEKFVDGGKAVSDLPTLAGNNDFTGENTFEEAIQAKKGTVVKNSLDETNYNAGYISRNDWTYLFPADSGTFALTKNIPTDYATQTALANTQRQVDGLYTLLEQKNEIYVQTATDTYTTRETAGGENIADGVQTPVKKITGKTVKTTNLFSGENVTTGNCTYENGVAKQIAADNSSTLVWKAQLYKDTTFVSQVEVQFLNTGRTPALTFEKTSDVNRLAFGLNGASVDTLLSIYISEFPNGEYTITWNVLNTTQGSISWNDIMLNEGSTALPYMPYFPGLKNAFFKEIVSTGRNLIPYPYTDGTKTLNGVTFTVNNDGTITVNGTATSLTVFFIADTDNNKIKLSLGVSYSLSGCPVGGGDDKFSLNVQTTSYNQIFTDFGNGYSGVTRYTDYYAFITISQGYTANNLVFKPMLNEGSTALPYEPYTQSVLSLPEAVELTEYDTAYPETGEIQRQSNTLTFNGTETWYTSIINNCYAYYVITKPVGFSKNGLISNKITTRVYNAISGQNEGCYMSNANFNAIVFWFLQTAYPNLSTSTAWKAQLAAWNEAGNPLTVTYKTAEVTTEQADFSADSYIAWKNGSETIEQGDTDNSIYGAENTVQQDYYLLTAPEEVTKE